jgi:hypothetical protein
MLGTALGYGAQKNDAVREAGDAWFLIKVTHACERRPFRDVGIYRDTVACETVMPSFNSSPWMRGAPQRKFARAISRIRRVSRAIRGASTGTT